MNKDRSFVYGVLVWGFNLIYVSNNLVFTKVLVMDDHIRELNVVKEATMDS